MISHPAAMPLLVAAATIVAAPLLAAVAMRFGIGAARPRVPAGIALALAAAASLGILGWWLLHTGDQAFEFGPRLGGGAVVHVDGVTAVMLPFVALCLLLIVVAAPRRFLDGPATAYFLGGAAATYALFLSAHPLVIVALWVATAVPVRLATRANCPERAARNPPRRRWHG